MLALVSPAKKMDMESTRSFNSLSQPQLIHETENLTKILKKLSQSQIQNLMGISEKLGALNHDRYQRFSTPFTQDNASPAITAFRGDTYVGLDADSLSDQDIAYAQNHLGILSGLYGVLRPLDLIQAYRLEMGTKLANENGEDLYDFWGDKITKTCNEMTKDHADKTVICLASNEYIKSVQTSALNGDFVTCHFKEVKDGTPKTIGLFAKRARGMMARFMVQNRIEAPEGLKAFDMDGYEFNPDLSDERNYTFLRDQT